MNTHVVTLTPSPRKDRREAVRTIVEPFRTQLIWAVDALIPEDTSLGMPSASNASVVDVHIIDALVLRDDMMEDFIKILSRLPQEEPENALGVLEALGQKDFECFSRLVAGAFFLNLKINEALGYGGQTAMLETPDYEALMEAIQPVIERGAIYTRF